MKWVLFQIDFFQNSVEQFVCLSSTDCVFLLAWMCGCVLALFMMTVPVKQGVPESSDKSWAASGINICQTEQGDALHND